MEGIAYRKEVYVPTISEPSLRWRTGRWRGAMSVPVLLPDDGPAVGDSTEIAAWASARGRAQLLPESLRLQVQEIVDQAERCLSAGRVRATQRALADAEALKEGLPPSLSWLGGAGVPIAAHVARGLIAKYGGEVPDDVETELAAAIEALAAAIGDRPHIVDDRLTFADLAAASAVAFIAPAADMRLGPRMRAAYSHEALSARHAALVAWRDAIDAEVRSLKDPA